MITTIFAKCVLPKNFILCLLYIICLLYTIDLIKMDDQHHTPSKLCERISEKLFVDANIGRAPPERIKNIRVDNCLYFLIFNN